MENKIKLLELLDLENNINGGSLNKIFKDTSFDTESLINIVATPECCAIFNNSKSLNEILQYLFEKVDNANIITNLNDAYNFLFFLGVNFEGFRNAASKTKMLSDIMKGTNKPTSNSLSNLPPGMPPELIELLQKLGSIKGVEANFKVVKLNGSEEFGNFEDKKSNYTYKLSENRLDIVDRANDNEITVTNNIENVINEIIIEEGFKNIFNKRIFAVGTDEKVSEVLPEYKDNKCISVKFEVLN